MDPEVRTLFPAGVRVLLVDNDVRFIKAASTLLDLLNFEVSTCYTLSSALRFLTASDKFKEIDVVLADAKKATTCGFDFRAIVEPDLRIPVVYFLSEKTKSSGDEADVLLRLLELASFILKKPLEGEKVCVLWRDIAWRQLQLKVRERLGAGDARQGSSSSGGSGASMLPPSPWAGAPSGGDEEARVHYRVMGGVSGGRKRRGGGARNPDSSSGSGVPAARRGRPANKQEQVVAVAGQQETDHTQPAPRRYRSRKAGKNNGASPSKPTVTPETIIDVDTYQPTRRSSEKQQQQQQQASGQAAKPKKQTSRFVQSYLRTLDVPPYNPSIFAAAVEPGSNIIDFSGGGPAPVEPSAGSSNIIFFSGNNHVDQPGSSTIIDFSDAGRGAAAGARTPSPAAVNRVPTAAPASPAQLVNQAPPAAPAAPPRLHVIQQAPPAPAPAGNVAVTPPAEATAMSASAIADNQLPASGSQQQEKEKEKKNEASFDILRRAFGPFPYQGPPQLQPVVQQGMFGGACNFAARSRNIQLPFQQPPPIAAGDPFAGMAAGGGAAAIGGAANAVHAAGNHGNVSDTSLVQPALNFGEGPDDELEAMLSMYATDDPHQVPQQADTAPMDYDNDINNEAMFMAPHQVLGVNDVAMAGGYAFNSSAEQFMAPGQVLGMGHSAVNDQAMAGGDGAFDIDGNAAAAAAFMEPQGFGAAPNGMNQLAVEDAPPAAFGPSVENEDDFSFPLADLLGMDMPMYDDAGNLVGLEGDAAAAFDAAVNYLNGEDDGMEDGGLAPAGDGAGIFDSMLLDNNLLPHYMNNSRE